MPRRPFDLSFGAAQDLIDIREFIARDSFDAAVRWQARLLREIRFLAQNPGIGHRRADLVGDFPVLFWPVRSYQIIYQVAGSRLQVVAVVQPGRDVSVLLARRMLQ